MIVLEFAEIHSWKRPGRRGSVYYDKQVEDKRRIGRDLVFQAQAQGLEYALDCPISVASIFIKRYPSKFPKYKRQRLNWWDTKPDTDNLEKFLFDMLQKQAGLISEDSRICAKACVKIWGDHDRTICFIDEWKVGDHIIVDSNRLCFGGVTCHLLDLALGEGYQPF